MQMTRPKPTSMIRDISAISLIKLIVQKFLERFYISGNISFRVIFTPMDVMLHHLLLFLHGIATYQVHFVIVL